jgi:hypothetical protein
MYTVFKQPKKVLHGTAQVELILNYMQTLPALADRYIMFAKAEVEPLITLWAMVLY